MTLELNEIREKFRQLVIQRAVDNGWSFEEEERGVRLLDGLGIAGDHWDGRTFERFFAYTEAGLRNAITFCSNTEV